MLEDPISVIVPYQFLVQFSVTVTEEITENILCMKDGKDPVSLIIQKALESVIQGSGRNIPFRDAIEADVPAGLRVDLDRISTLPLEGEDSFVRLEEK